MLSNDFLSNLITSKFPELLSGSDTLTLRTVEYRGVINTDHVLVQSSSLDVNPGLINIKSGSDWRADMLNSGKQLHGRGVSDTSYVVDSPSRAGVSSAFAEFNSEAGGGLGSDGIFYDHRVKGASTEFTPSPLTALLHSSYKGITRDMVRAYIDKRRLCKFGGSITGVMYLFNPVLYKATGLTGVYNDRQITEDINLVNSNPAGYIAMQEVNDLLWDVSYPIFAALNGNVPHVLCSKLGGVHSAGASGFTDPVLSVSRNVNYNSSYASVIAGFDAHQALINVADNSNQGQYPVNESSADIVGWYEGTGLWHTLEYAQLSAIPSAHPDYKTWSDVTRIRFGSYKAVFPNYFYSILLKTTDYTRSVSPTDLRRIINCLTFTLQRATSTMRVVGDVGPVKLGQDLATMLASADRGSGANVFGDIREFNTLFGVPSNEWHVKGKQIEYLPAEQLVVGETTFLREHASISVDTLFWAISQDWYRAYYASGFGIYTPRDSNIQANVLKTWDEFDVNTVYLAITADEYDTPLTVSDLREARAYAKARARACKTNDFLMQPATPTVTWGQLNEKSRSALPRRVWMDAFNDTTFSNQYTFEFSEPVIYTKVTENGVALFKRTSGGVEKTVNPTLIDADRTLVLRDKYFNTAVTLTGVSWDEIITEDAEEKEVMSDNEDLRGLSVGVADNRAKQIGFGAWINPYTEVLINRLDDEQKFRLHLKNVINFDKMGKQFVKLFDSYNTSALVRKLKIPVGPEA